MGWSFGGYLAPRGASGEPRIAALITHPGQWDQIEALPMPQELKDRLATMEPEELDPYLSDVAASPIAHWKLAQRGLWVHGLQTLGQYIVEMSCYRLSDVVHKIQCPTLVAWSEGDPIAVGAGRLYNALSCPKTLVRFTAAEGSGGHCEAWNRSRFDQQVFDWLDETLKVPPK